MRDVPPPECIHSPFVPTSTPEAIQRGVKKGERSYSGVHYNFGHFSSFPVLFFFFFGISVIPQQCTRCQSLRGHCGVLGVHANCIREPANGGSSPVSLVVRALPTYLRGLLKTCRHFPSVFGNRIANYVKRNIIWLTCPQEPP